MKIGVGIITFERFDRFKESFENLLKNSRDVDEIVVVEDASQKDKEKYDEYLGNILMNHVKVIRNSVNIGVGNSKNKAMKYFYDKDFDYFFTLEDDINVISPDVFVKYIEASEKTGLHYFNFGLHGYHNPTWKERVINGFKVRLFPNIVGAFTLYTKKLVDEIGFHDVNYLNAVEHIDYTYLAVKKGLTTPFWEFVDLVDSDKYLREQPNSIEESSIRPRKDWQKNIALAQKYFKQKHGVSIGEIRRP